MSKSKDGVASREAEAAANRELVTSQRAVNERLVLSALRAHEETEAAEATAKELRASERELRTLADMLPILAWYANPDGVVPWYNRRWFEYTGTTCDEQKGWLWRSVHDPDDLARVVAKWKAALARGEPWEDEFRLRRHDGQLRWFLSRAVPLRDARGQVVRWFGTNIDIDDQKRAEAAIVHQKEVEKERLRMMFDESPTAACVLRGPNFEIELVNPLILDLWGKTGAIIGQPLMEALPELRGQGFDDLLRGVLETNVAYHGKDVLARLDRARNGVLQDVYFDFVYAPLRRLDGTTEGVFVHAYEVTEKVNARRHVEALRAEAERLLASEKEARKDSEAANQVKDAFLATMSHELRTPLNAILGWSTMLRRGTHDKKGVDRALATIERNAKAQARLIEDILDVSRIISGKLRLDLHPVDMNAIALSAIDVVRPAADAKGVRLLVDLASDDGAERLFGDADRLQQVMWNLLINAIKFTPPEGTVSLRVERVGSTARFVVRDTGQGIPSEHLPFVFERFRQVDSSTTRRHGGLGLGLAIVRHLVEMHGGSTAVESGGAGLGATFTVSLPIRAVHEAEAEPVVEASPPSTISSRPPTDLSGIRILVVDDDEDSRLLLESALGHVGASVVAVDSARAAFAFIESHPVDVLISDIGMPDEDGFSLMQRVRALPASRGGQVPAIALTAYARSADAVRARQVGYQRHLAKPADVDKLTRSVADLVVAGAP